MAYMKMNLRMFEGGAAGAGAAPAAGPDGGAEAAEVQEGVLEDGTQVDARLAARMEKQARKRRERGEEPVRQAAQKTAVMQQENAPGPETQKSLDDQWQEAKRGMFREQYARDVQAAVQDRFKNQKDANEQLAKVQPALQALAKKLGLDENDVDGVVNTILDDDSLYEDAAEEAGMTVEGYKNYLAMQKENQAIKAREQQEQQDMFMRRHFQNLAMQGEEMKKTFPNFDLRKEMENETFRRLVAPNSGLDVHAAYYAVHHAELEPQAMAYGIKRGMQQMSQTLQANKARPVEGAMKRGQPADVAVDPRSMSREERQRLIERARRGEKIQF